MKSPSRVLTGLLAGLLFACSESEKPEPEPEPVDAPEISVIEVDPGTVSLEIGEGQVLVAVAKDASGAIISDVAFSWSSSAPSVATVVEGAVSALAAGEAEIVASAQGKHSAPVTVSVVAAAQPGFELALSTDKVPVLQGGSESLEVTVIRHEGFAGAVSLTGSGFPSGVSMDAASVAVDQDQVTLVLRAEAGAPHSLPTEVTLLGTSGDIAAEKAFAVTVYGAPGALDTSFAGGKVVLPAGVRDDYAHALAVQADGKVVVAGEIADNGGDIAVMRLDRDGALDTSFGADGVASTDIGRSDVAYAVAVQSDGKIVVAGATTAEGTGRDFALVRYLADGMLDPAFGQGGVVTVPFGADSDTACAILLQPDGKIVVGGDSNQGSSTTGVDFALARLLEDGSLDPDFGGDGTVLTSVHSGSARDSIYALAAQTIDGEPRIVAAGGEGDFTLARYLDNGELDLGFGTEGKLGDVLGSSIGAARAVQTTETGAILVAGHHTNDFALVRLDAAGALDATFGEAGIVVTPISETNWDAAHGLAVEADGNILVGGWAYEANSSAGNFALARYTGDGQLDASFGTSGVVITEMIGPMKRDEARALVLQADDRVPNTRVLLAGYASGSDADFAVARYWR